MADIGNMDATMDASALFREEIITDRKIGTIRVLTPVTDEGVTDASREVIFMGETQIMTQMGALPISFTIPAKNLKEAVAGYAQAAKKGVEDTIQKIEDLRRQAASRIVTPGDEGFAQAASKIQMP